MTGYGTIPGSRWTMDTECGHMVVSVSLIRNGYEYGTVLDRDLAVVSDSVVLHSFFIRTVTDSF